MPLRWLFSGAGGFIIKFSKKRRKKRRKTVKTPVDTRIDTRRLCARARMRTQRAHAHLYALIIVRF